MAGSITINALLSLKYAVMQALILKVVHVPNVILNLGHGFSGLYN